MTQRIVAGGLVVLSAIGAGIVAADPTTLGLPPIAVAWIALGMLGLNAIMAFLQPVHRP